MQMKLVLTNYLSTAEEIEAASEVVLDAFTQTVWWSWGVINALTLEHFKCINNFIINVLLIFFKHPNKCWKKCNNTFKYD